MTETLSRPPTIAPRAPVHAVTRALLVFVLWTVFGLLWSAHSFFGADRGDEGVGFLESSDHVVPFYWAWALITPAIFWVLARNSDRYPPGEKRIWMFVVLVTPVVVVAHGVVYLAVLQVLGVEPGALFRAGRMVSYIRGHAGGDVATYFTLVGVHMLIASAKRARERDLLAAELAARLARADLELLRWQLQPHFLFNALNTVSTLVLKEQTRDANRAIELIARYLRSALAQRADSTVTLAEELASLQRYVEIEALRFGATLRLEVRIDDDMLHTRIPGSILQPLVENAIRHGPASRGQGPIVIAGRRTGRRVHVTISDPGTPLSIEGGDRTDGFQEDGFGLRYVKERLRLFYGGEASFSLIVASGGTTATLDLPAMVSA
ncbi:MAG: histidine kinase [Gemmatimonadaceae bacterium]